MRQNINRRVGRVLSDSYQNTEARTDHSETLTWKAVAVLRLIETSSSSLWSAKSAGTYRNVSIAFVTACPISQYFVVSE